jgi:hypothetical protein
MLVQRMRLLTDADDGAQPTWMEYRSGEFEIRGRFQPTAALANYDPGTDAARLTVGPAYVLSASEQPGTRVVVRKHRRVSFRSTRMTRLRGYMLSIDLQRGRFVARARGVDVGALLSQGPARVAVSLSIGDVEYHATIAPRAYVRRWQHRAPRGTPIPSGPEGPGSEGSETQFSVLGSGDYGWQGPAFTRAFAVRTQDDLDRVWSFRSGGDPAPQVDFTQDIVLVIDLGRRPTLRYRADVVRVLVGTCGPIVEFTEFEPSVAEQAEGHPWTAVTIGSVDGDVEWRRVLE